MSDDASEKERHRVPFTFCPKESASSWGKEWRDQTCISEDLLRLRVDGDRAEGGIVVMQKRDRKSLTYSKGGQDARGGKYYRDIFEIESIELGGGLGLLVGRTTVSVVELRRAW